MQTPLAAGDCQLTTISTASITHYLAAMLDQQAALLSPEQNREIRLTNLALRHDAANEFLIRLRADIEQQISQFLFWVATIIANAEHDLATLLSSFSEANSILTPTD